MAECGCKVQFNPVEPKASGYHIKYCPVHAAAPKMLRALKHASLRFKEAEEQLRADKRTLEADCCLGARLKCDEAVADAEKG